MYLFICFNSSFQTRINECMRQMASLLYQIKGPVNANNKNQVEADSDNMLRPLMDFLDGKWVVVLARRRCFLFIHWIVL